MAAVLLRTEPPLKPILTRRASKKCDPVFIMARSARFLITVGDQTRNVTHVGVDPTTVEDKVGINESMFCANREYPPQHQCNTEGHNDSLRLRLPLRKIFYRDGEQTRATNHTTRTLTIQMYISWRSIPLMRSALHGTEPTNEDFKHSAV